jgi:hypothetical protein
LGIDISNAAKETERERKQRGLQKTVFPVSFFGDGWMVASKSLYCQKRKTNEGVNKSQIPQIDNLSLYPQLRHSILTYCPHWIDVSS